jgi:hypothetical protein
MIQTTCASKFKWKDGVGVANSSELFEKGRTPREFDMISPKTGKTKTFVYDLEEAIANESWDGEFQKHKTKCGLVAIIWNY